MKNTVKRSIFVLAPVLLMLINCEEQNISATEPESKATESVAAPEIDVASVKEGQVYATVCAACHGVQGEGNPLFKSPSIAGLPAWYIKEQTDKFSNGMRGYHPEDVPGQMMRGIATALSREQIVEAAKFVETLPATKTDLNGDKASVDRGRYIFANECMACHRFSGSGEVVFHSAPLVSMNRDYLVRQLKNYRKGWRGTHESDFYGQKMNVIGETMSDKSIEDVVNFIGSLAHGDDPRPAMER